MKIWSSILCWKGNDFSLLLAIQLLLLFVRNRKDRSITEYKHQLSDHKVNTGISITEIAAICGFGNITYFERVFKRITEYTPLQYRKAITIPENRIQK